MSLIIKFLHENLSQTQQEYIANLSEGGNETLYMMLLKIAKDESESPSGKIQEEMIKLASICKVMKRHKDTSNESEIYLGVIELYKLCGRDIFVREVDRFSHMSSESLIQILESLKQRLEDGMSSKERLVIVHECIRAEQPLADAMPGTRRHLNPRPPAIADTSMHDLGPLGDIEKMYNTDYKTPLIIETIYSWMQTEKFKRRLEMRLLSSAMIKGNPLAIHGAINAIKESLPHDHRQALVDAVFSAMVYSQSYSLLQELLKLGIPFSSPDIRIDINSNGVAHYTQSKASRGTYVVVMGGDGSGASEEIHQVNFLLKQGFDVVVVDGRFGRRIDDKFVTRQIRKKFQHHETKPLVGIAIVAHGGVATSGVDKGRHFIKTSMHGRDVSSVDLVTSIVSAAKPYAKAMTPEASSVENPLTVLLTSCYSGAAIEELAEVLPERTKVYSLAGSDETTNGNILLPIGKFQNIDPALLVSMMYLNQDVESTVNYTFMRDKTVICIELEAKKVTQFLYRKEFVDIIKANKARIVADVHQIIDEMGDASYLPRSIGYTEMMLDRMLSDPECSARGEEESLKIKRMNRAALILSYYAYIQYCPDIDLSKTLSAPDCLPQDQLHELFEAIKEGRVERATELLSSYEIGLRDQYGRTPLRFLIQNYSQNLNALLLHPKMQQMIKDDHSYCTAFVEHEMPSTLNKRFLELAMLLNGDEASLFTEFFAAFIVRADKDTKSALGISSFLKWVNTKSKKEIDRLIDSMRRYPATYDQVLNLMNLKSLPDLSSWGKEKVLQLFQLIDGNTDLTSEEITVLYDCDLLEIGETQGLKELTKEIVLIACNTRGVTFSKINAWSRVEGLIAKLTTLSTVTGLACDDIDRWLQDQDKFEKILLLAKKIPDITKDDIDEAINNNTLHDLYIRLLSKL